jgi:sugar lactone lactonase YvrE
MDRTARLFPAVLTLSVAAIAGCKPRMTEPAATGSLTVTITSADGSTPSVVVSGPNHYNMVISTTQTLSGLTQGTYTIVADTAVVPDSVVGTITDSGNVTGSPASVTASAIPTVTVVYSTKGRIGGMWVANTNYGTLPELNSSQLRTSGTLVPAETLATPISGPAGLALDAAGNMWESDYAGDSLLMYSVADRNAGGGTPPTRVVTSPALQNANGIGFDVNGNLWVANCGHNGNTPALLEFSAAQLMAGGTVPTPAATINTSAYATCPYGIAFDAGGDVWVTDFDASHVLKYSAAQLAAGSGSPAPSDTIGVALGTGFTDAVAMDASGNLWAGADAKLAEYTPAMQTGGSPAPSALVKLPSGTFLNGLAFDNRGSLWVADAHFGYMYALTESQLISGTPTPAISILYTVHGVYPQQPLFDKYAGAPAPSGARLTFRPIAPAGASSRVARHLASGKSESQLR